MVVGISEGGASIQGLNLALDISNEVYVFHDNGNRTFHPKVYIAYGDSAGKVMVGSHNLTRGGLVNNYEAGVIVSLDFNIQQDKTFFEKCYQESFVRLIEDENVCIRLDDAVLKTLIGDPIYRIGDEDAGRSPGSISSSQPSGPGGDSDSHGGVTPGASQSIFGKSKNRLKNAPSFSRKNSNKSLVKSQKPTAPKTAKKPQVAQPAVPSSGQVVKRWYKQMAKADAQWPNAGTNPTGHVTLTQAGHSINSSTYFKNVFFSGVNWHKINPKKTRERASVEFEVIIYGKLVGNFMMDVDHNPEFEAGQNNRTTTLRWGPDVGTFVKMVNYEGKFINLERTANSKYKLIISDKNSGPFMA